MPQIHMAMPNHLSFNGHEPQAPKRRLPEPPSMRGKKTMTREEFKEWLKSIDSNGDGCISKDELRAALKGLGMSFTWWKAWRAMVHADLDQDNSIKGEQEIDELIKYAQKHWGSTVT